MSRISIDAIPVILLQLLLLAGCAGSGGGIGQKSPAANPAGLYFGTLSSGFIHNTLVLENGQYYVLYGVSTTASLKLAGFVQGSGTINKGSFDSKDMKDFFWDGSVTGGTLNAAYTGNTFNGTLAKRTLDVSLASAPLESTSYNYGKAANLPDIAGGWTLTTLAGTAATLSVDPSGTFTGTNGRCTYTGTLAPRASGKTCLMFRWHLAARLVPRRVWPYPVLPSSSCCRTVSHDNCSLRA